MNLARIPIQATTRKLKANYTLEVQQDLVSLHSGGYSFSIDYNSKDDVKTQYKKFKSNWPFKMHPYLDIEEEMMELMRFEVSAELDNQILSKMRHDIIHCGVKV